MDARLTLHSACFFSWCVCVHTYRLYTFAEDTLGELRAPGLHGVCGWESPGPGEREESQGFCGAGG